MKPTRELLALMLQLQWQSNRLLHAVAELTAIHTAVTDALRPPAGEAD